MDTKYVLITGASRGIGREAALYFAERGYHVFLNCNHSVERLKQVSEEIDAQKSGACSLVPCDLGNPDAVRAMFHNIYSICSHLDILVNNAGIAHIGLLMDMSDDEWNRILQTNLSSVF